MVDGIHISNREIFDSVRELTRKTDNVLTELRSVRDTLEDHDQDIEMLKARRWPLSSLTVIIGIVAIGITVATAMYTNGG